MWNWPVGRLLSKVVTAHAQSFTFFAVIVYVVTYLVKNTPIYKPKSGFHAFCWLRDTEIGSKPNVVDDCYWFPSWCCFQWSFPLWKTLKNPWYTLVPGSSSGNLEASWHQQSLGRPQFLCSAKSLWHWERYHSTFHVSFYSSRLF